MVFTLQTPEYGIALTIVVLTVFIMLFSSAMIVFFLLSRKRISQADLELREVVIKSQRKTLKAVLKAQEKERERIARDLHDQISAKINVIKLNAAMIQDEALTEEEEKKALKRVITAATSTLKEARDITHEILPPVLDKFGLQAAINEFIEGSPKVPMIEFTYNWESFSVKKDHEIHVFRIIQELVNNTWKHAQASYIQIIFGFEDHHFISYRDNGTGFKQGEVKGLGSSNIEIRASIAGATTILKPMLQSGVHYIFEFDK